MVAERKTRQRAGQQPPPRRAAVVIGPGLANRGFESLDPERQRQSGGDGGESAPRGGTGRHEGGTAPRGGARDAPPRPLRAGKGPQDTGGV
jgi:hypothetical protein